MPTIDCKLCGTRFGCEPDGVCWCMQARAKLPVPEESSVATCVCPQCLEKLTSQPSST